MKKAWDMLQGVVANAFVSLFSITCIFPIIWMIYSSLKTDKEFSLNILSLPSKPEFGNYARAITEGKIGSYFMNSMFNTLSALVVVLVISFITGYCISRFRFKGRTFIYYMFLSGMLIPIYALLIPIVVECNTLGLLN